MRRASSLCCTRTPRQTRSQGRDRECARGRLDLRRVDALRDDHLVRVDDVHQERPGLARARLDADVVVLPEIHL